MQLPHRKLAKNHPGRVKTGRQTQTIDTDRCSCLPNPSNGPISEEEGRRDGLHRQEGRFADPIVQLPPIENWPKITPAESKRAAKRKP